MLQDEVNFYEKTVFLYVTGYYHLKLGDTSSGKEDMRKALQIFKYLGEDPFYNTYNEHYCQKVLGNNKEC